MTNQQVVRLPSDAITTKEQIEALQRHGRALTDSHVGQLTAALATAERLAIEISGGGDLYHKGVREIARRLADQLEMEVKNIESLQGKRCN